MRAFSVLVIKLFGALPLSLRRLVGKLLGWLFGFIPTRERRIAELQLELFLGKSMSHLVPGIYASLGQTLFESFNLQPILRRSDYWIDCPNVQLLDRRNFGGRGLVLLAAHTGNWDLMAAYGIQHGLKLGVVGRETRNKFLHYMLMELRNSYGAETLWREGGEIRRIMHKLKSGEAVGALIDQDTDVGGIFIPFFGRDVNTPSTLVDLAKRTNSDIVSAFIFRLPNGRFKVELKAFDTTESTAGILSEFNRRLESCIREYPSQWVWFHKRWRSSPNQKRMGTHAYLEYLQRELND